MTKRPSGVQMALAGSYRKRWSAGEQLLLALTLLSAVVITVESLRRSLWLDETLTYWVVKGSLAELVVRAIHYQGQTPFYFGLTWPLAQLVGPSEVALRLPSLCAFLATTWLVYHIGAHFAGREAGLAAALLFNGLWFVTGGPIGARPYAMATFWLLLSLYHLILWADRPARRRLWYSAGSALAAIYAHLLVAPLLLVHALYLLIHRRLLPTSIRWWGTVGAVSALGLIPVVYVLLVLGSKWNLYSFAPMPGLADLARSWTWHFFGLGVVGVPVAVSRLRLNFAWTSPGVRRADWGLLAMWALWPALFLFALSHLRGTSIFVPRYVIWQLPAVALLAAVVASGFPARGVRAVIYGGYLAAFLLLGSRVVRTEGEDWRAAARYIDQNIADSSTTVLVWSGLTETKDLDWFDDDANRDYILSPVHFYDFPGRIRPVPHPGVVDGLTSFLDQAEASRLERETSVWIVAYHYDAAVEIASWITGTGTTSAEFHQFGSITVGRLYSERR